MVQGEKMKDLSVDFNNAEKLSLKELKTLILDERDSISKNWIVKMYRENEDYSLSKSYEIYYKSKLWKECVRPLLIAYGIKSGKYEKILELYKCRCGNITSYNKLVPHHVKYPPLVRKYKYKGFDNRIKLNHPDRILFVCDKCHGQIHKEIKNREEDW